MADGALYCRGPFELTLPNEHYATGNERPNAFYVNYAITQNQFHEVFVISRTKKSSENDLKFHNNSIDLKY